MGEREGISVKVGVHQGSGLSPMLFIIMLEALSRESSVFKEGLLWNCFMQMILFFLIAETNELLLEKVIKWKEEMERRVKEGSESECW